MDVVNYDMGFNLFFYNEVFQRRAITMIHT
jgi:hypothetical protein